MIFKDFLSGKGYHKRTKEELLKHIKTIEDENKRLEKERNAAISTLQNWKRINDMSGTDSLEDDTIKAIKLIMKISDKVRTRF